MKLRTVLSAFALMVPLAAVHAASIPLPVGIATLEDNNLEYLSRLNTATNQYEIVTRENFASAGVLQIGDRLTAVVGFEAVREQVNNTIFTNLGMPGLELTGISQIEVKGFFVDGFGNNRIEWGVSSDFEALYGAGAMAALFSQNPGNFDVGCSTADVMSCVTPATDGDPWMVVGIAADDDYWSSTGAGVPVGAAATTSSGSAFGQANFALSILENNTGYTFGQQADTVNPVYNPAGLVGDGMVDLIGSGQLLGGDGLNGPWFARSDFDFTLNRTVPEPASLALLGIGLAGLGFGARRRAS